MRKFNFWKKISNYAAILGGILFALFTYFKAYIHSILLPLLFLSALTIVIFLLAEVMKFIKKEGKMKVNNYRRILNIEKGLMLFSAVSVIFPILNEIFFKFKISQFIEGYIFFFSTGLYIGFLICRKEYKRFKKENNTLSRLCPKE
jgi:hypothetical protein